MKRGREHRIRGSKITGKWPDTDLWNSNARELCLIFFYIYFEALMIAFSSSKLKSLRYYKYRYFSNTSAIQVLINRDNLNSKNRKLKHLFHNINVSLTIKVQRSLNNSAFCYPASEHRSHAGAAIRLSSHPAQTVAFFISQNAAMRYSQLYANRYSNFRPAEF